MLMVEIPLAVTSWKLNAYNFATLILHVDHLNMHLDHRHVLFIPQTISVKIALVVTDMSCSVLVRISFIALSKNLIQNLQYLDSVRATVELWVIN